jgi:hypothetical protein
MLSRMRATSLPQPGSKPRARSSAATSSKGRCGGRRRSGISAWRRALRSSATLLDGVVQHQLLAAVGVHAQEVQQPLVALADLLEQAAGQARFRNSTPRPMDSDSCSLYWSR